MPTDVLMPQMGESITEGTLTKWLKKPGDTVMRDEPLFEISTDKVDAEIPSPVNGTLGDIKVHEGATVGVNTVVCTVNAEGDVLATRTETSSNSSKVEDSVAPSAEVVATLDSANSLTIPSTPSSTSTEVRMPQMGESITEGTLTRWLKKVGETVQQDEPIFEISTDKVDAEIPSPAAGILKEIKVLEGSIVSISTVVAVIGGHASGSAVDKTLLPAQPTALPAEPQIAADRPRTSPLVRKIAAENSVGLHNVFATGTSGRITKSDILQYLQGTPKAGVTSQASTQFQDQVPSTEATHSSYTQAQSAPATTQAVKAAMMPNPQPGELVPMSKMRSIIARRMVESKHTSAHVHTIFKVDMTRVVRLREKEKTKYEQRNGVKLTYMPFIARSAVQALRKHPIVNAATEGEAIRYSRHINIGIAVALEWGLIVPVIKQAEDKSFLGIARSIVDVADRARSKKLGPEEVAGGTFTLTNSGIFGEQFGTPIIAQPQSAILGIGGLNKEPVVLTDKDGNDSIAIRSVQRFTLGFDHRIIDGSDAGKFMSDFKAYLENWADEIG